MKKIVLIICALLLTACTQPPLNQSANEPEVPTEETGYIETFDEFEFTKELELLIEDRHLLCEDAPENVAENLVFERFYYNISGDFDQYSQLHAKENEALQISATNAKKLFDEGVYIREFIIHTIQTLSLEEIANSESDFVNIYQEDVDKYNLERYSIVRVEYTMAHSQASIEQGPQLGDGTYTRHYLVGMPDNDDSWYLYEVYWY